MANGTPRETRGGGDCGERELAGLVRKGAAYVPAVARRYARSGLDRDELIAAGNLGLVQAALRFDPSRNLKFITYANWWIRKAIVEAVETLSGPVRMPRYRYEKLRWIKRSRRRWTVRHGAEPTIDELAAASGVSAEQVRRLLAAEPHGISLDQPTHHDDRPLSESIHGPEEACPQSSLIRRDLGKRLHRELARLGARERKVIRLRFGLDGELPLPLRAVGRQLGLSRERVRRIELEALLKIRRVL
jgi:DNA-directed RNA polymerase sigma subunit (sigma70/sigma32)